LDVSEVILDLEVSIAVVSTIGAFAADVVPVLTLAVSEEVLVAVEDLLSHEAKMVAAPKIINSFFI